MINKEAHAQVYADLVEHAKTHGLICTCPPTIQHESECAKNIHPKDCPCDGTCEADCTCSRQWQEAAKEENCSGGQLIGDAPHIGCICTPEKQDWDGLIDEQIDNIDEGLAIKKDESNRLGIYTSASNLGTRKIEIKSIIRKEKELSKEEGRREGYEDGKALRGKEWKQDIEEVRLEVIAEVVEWENNHPLPSVTTQFELKRQQERMAFLASLKTNSK